jgi:LmbE family N-acetylglucosaminyl deacetylase
MTHGDSFRNQLGGEGDRACEALRSAEILLDLNPGEGKQFAHLGDFHDQELDFSGRGLIRFIEELLKEIQPAMILTHAHADLHDDHRQVHLATLSAARGFGGSVLFYQAPSTIPNEFKPNFFVVLDPHSLDMKEKSLAAHFSQKDREFISHERVAGMARAWALFHRLKYESLEAFELYQSYWE